MIIFEGRKNIFESTMQTITCPINTVGVMGKGLALEFRRTYPELFDFYRKHYFPGGNSDVLIRQLLTFPVNRNRSVLLFPTKKHWRDASDLNWVVDNLSYLADNYKTLDITSLSMPPIGCGLGGLNYRDVQPLIYEHLDPLPISVELIY